jgi:hypothetical protein
MSYDTVEAGLLSVIRLLANYSDTNSSRGDYRVLARGVERAVVLAPGSIPSRDVIAAPRRVSTVWEILIQLLVPYGGEISTAAEKIRTDRQELMDHIDRYPTLNGVSNIVHAFVEGGRQPERWEGESRNWWTQTLTMRVIEHVTVEIA